MASATFTIYQNSAGRYQWRLQAPNHKIIADSGFSYDSPMACALAVRMVKDEITGAVVSRADKFGAAGRAEAERRFGRGSGS